MFILSLLLALSGFAALVFALIYGSVAWAVAAIVLGTVGVGILIVDGIRRRRR